MALNGVTYIEYMCSRCGAIHVMGAEAGKPLPGKCLRNNGNRHMWVVNRKRYSFGAEPKHDYKKIEYMCRHCGKKQIMGDNMGKPIPGVCPKRTSGMPHSWIINKKF